MSVRMRHLLLRSVTYIVVEEYGQPICIIPTKKLTGLSISMVSRESVSISDFTY
jgi:hypothetical protein